MTEEDDVSSEGDGRGEFVTLVYGNDVIMNFGVQHRVTDARQWTNPHRVGFTDWRSACGGAGTKADHLPFDARSSLLRKATCRVCFPGVRRT